MACPYKNEKDLLLKCIGVHNDLVGPRNPLHLVDEELYAEDLAIVLRANFVMDFRNGGVAKQGTKEQGFRRPPTSWDEVERFAEKWLEKKGDELARERDNKALKISSQKNASSPPWHRR